MKNSEQPAYPNYTDKEDCRGLTKREEFSRSAMQGILSDVHVQFWMKTDPRYTGENFAQVVAINSVEFADALLLELDKQPAS